MSIPYSRVKFGPEDGMEQHILMLEDQLREQRAHVKGLEAREKELEAENKELRGRVRGVQAALLGFSPGGPSAPEGDARKEGE